MHHDTSVHRDTLQCLQHDTCSVTCALMSRQCEQQSSSESYRWRVTLIAGDGHHANTGQRSQESQAALNKHPHCCNAFHPVPYGLLPEYGLVNWLCSCTLPTVMQLCANQCLHAHQASAAFAHQSAPSLAVLQVLLRRPAGPCQTIWHCVYTQTGFIMHLAVTQSSVCCDAGPCQATWPYACTQTLCMSRPRTQAQGGSM